MIAKKPAMNRQIRKQFPGWMLILVLVAALHGQEHQHEHGEKGPEKKIAPPRVFLDKSLRIVQYQLKRLDNQRLLLVERKTDDPKYAPVYAAILARAGMSPQYREEALKSLVELNRSHALPELLKALGTMDADDQQQLRTGRQLATMLLGLPGEQLAANKSALLKSTESENRLVRSVGYAGLISGGAQAESWQRAQASPVATLDWLSAVSLLPQPAQRSAQRNAIVGLLAESHPVAVRQLAIQTLAVVPLRQQQTFELLAPFVEDAEYRTQAVRTLLDVPAKLRDPALSAKLVDVLVKHAEATTAAKRTTDPFLDAMQLADQLLARIPGDASRSYRNRLREITVRVVRIHTVEEEMRYDIPYFAVESGRPVQVVLKNEDLMPHNLVVTTPGSLQVVAQEGTLLGPNPGFQGKPYVPKRAEVLFATGMVQSRQQERLTFTAPSEIGEYPFVCTFPRHWMRMYGVMIVVKDLDAWQKKPTMPKDPLGNNRAFVQSWKVEDFKDELAAGLRARSPQIGEKIFKAATCAQCHKVRGQGGAVGPELTDILKRWKGDRLALLREVLDPSHRIDPKYAVQMIATDDGRVFTGIVQAEDKQTISLLVNPEASKPTVIKRSEIDEMVKTSKSMMPKALLDRFTKDEIFELMAFLISLAPPSP
jgi:putative heme-binding domain-containing protein